MTEVLASGVSVGLICFVGLIGYLIRSLIADMQDDIRSVKDDTGAIREDLSRRITRLEEWRIRHLEQTHGMGKQ